MRGLDPRIHQTKRHSFGMDCRVKPGNDGTLNGDQLPRNTGLRFSMKACTASL
ncbi:hypothetical protein ACVWY5_007354 [Bradyrhizobium sp. USDA 3256]